MVTADKRIGTRRGISPRLPKTHGIPRPKPLRPRGIRRPRFDLTFSQYLESLSRFGGTKLEQLVDGAAEQANIRFDAAQVTVYLPDGRYTRIDRVIFNPPTAIYIDGFQHDLRPDVAYRDEAIRDALRTMGYRVVSLGWRGLLQDAQSEVLKVLYER